MRAIASQYSATAPDARHACCRVSSRRAPRFLRSSRDARCPPTKRGTSRACCGSAPATRSRVFDGARPRVPRARRARRDATASQLDSSSRSQPAPEPRVPLTLAQAVLKGDKMDDVVRDATMMGVAAIEPLVTRARSRSRIEAGRAPRALAADRGRVGEAVPPRGRAGDRRRHARSPTGCRSDRAGAARALVEPSAGRRRHAVARRSSGTPPAAASLLVGPEGGWSAAESRRRRRRRLRPDHARPPHAARRRRRRSSAIGAAAVRVGRSCRPAQIELATSRSIRRPAAQMRGPRRLRSARRSTADAARTPSGSRRRSCRARSR